jgi:hypothetical protein
MNKYECDGCGKVVELEEPPEQSCGCPTSWGWMLVGGIAWYEYHDQGIHPMTRIVGEIEELLASRKKIN